MTEEAVMIRPVNAINGSATAHSMKNTAKKPPKVYSRQATKKKTIARGKTPCVTQRHPTSNSVLDADYNNLP